MGRATICPSTKSWRLTGLSKQRRTQVLAIRANLDFKATGSCCAAALCKGRTGSRPGQGFSIGDRRQGRTSTAAMVVVREIDGCPAHWHRTHVERRGRETAGPARKSSKQKKQLIDVFRKRKPLEGVRKTERRCMTRKGLLGSDMCGCPVLLRKGGEACFVSFFRHEI